MIISKYNKPIGISGHLHNDRNEKVAFKIIR